MNITTAARNAACAALVALIDAGSGPGYIEVRSGTQPGNANDAPAGSLLATVILPDPSFDTAFVTPGVAIAHAIDAVEATGNGTATWFRVYDSDANNVEDGSVSTTGSGGDMQLNTTSITSGIDVSVTGWSITMPAT